MRLRPARELVDTLAGIMAPIAIVDPHGAAEAFAELFDLDGVEIAGVYVQDVARIGRPVLGRVGRSR